MDATNYLLLQILTSLKKIEFKLYHPEISESEVNHLIEELLKPYTSQDLT